MTQIGPIVFACDDGYAMPLATALRSLIDATPASTRVDVRIITDQFGREARERVEQSLPRGRTALTWMHTDLAQFRSCSTMAHVSKITYARLLLPSLLSESSRVLYLDADILVLDDLEPLWNISLDGAPIGAVLDNLDSKLKAGDPEYSSVPVVERYFNAGVLLIDLDRWRAERVGERALEYLAAHPELPFADQDVLNVICDGCWHQLDARWNFQDHYQRGVASMDHSKKPAVVHFVTSLKPWLARTMSVNATLYDAHRSRTLYARTRAEIIGDTVVEAWYRLKRRLRQYPLLRHAWESMRPARSASQRAPGLRVG